MEERLTSIGRRSICDMMAVVKCLVLDCADNDKIYLGVSHRLRVMGKEPASRCQFDANWVKASLKISEAHGGDWGRFMAGEMRKIPWGCKGNFSTLGVTKEDTSSGSED